jgi:hypothetical protein
MIKIFNERLNISFIGIDFDKEKVLYKLIFLKICRMCMTR